MVMITGVIRRNVKNIKKGMSMGGKGSPKKYQYNKNRYVKPINPSISLING